MYILKPPTFRMFNSRYSLCHVCIVRKTEIKKDLVCDYPIITRGRSGCSSVRVLP